jgi:hypothetical protein
VVKFNGQTRFASITTETQKDMKTTNQTAKNQKSTKTIMKKTQIALMAAAALFACGTMAQAQSLGIYYNLQSYGTVSGGGTIIDTIGNTTATLNNNPNTSLTSGGLTISGGSSQNTGLTLNNALGGFTGSFAIQDWVSFQANNANSIFFGANNGPMNGWIGDGQTGVTTLIASQRWYSGIGFCTGGTPYNQYGWEVGTGDQTSPTLNALYDVVLNYNASTTTFTEYVNGVSFGSTVENLGINSLAGAIDFVIGGCPTEPWGDASADETTKDLLIYNGALAADQVSALDAAGAGASLDTINAVVPEPGSFALMALAGVTGLCFRRSIRSSMTAR